MWFNAKQGALVPLQIRQKISNFSLKIKMSPDYYIMGLTK